MLLDNTFVSDARVEKEAQSLIENGASVSVWCENSNSLPINEIRNGIHIVRCINPTLYSPLKKGYASHLKLLVNDLINEDFDILHCHDFHMLAIGTEVKKKSNAIKLIYDAHEFLIGWPFYVSADNWKNRFKGWIVWIYLKFREKKNLQIVDGTITISEGIASRLKNAYGLKNEPLVLRNFVRKMTIQHDKNYFRKLYSLSENSTVLIHSGSIYYTEGQLDKLFEIIRKSENLVLIFIGSTDRFYKIQQNVLSLPCLNNKIFFHKYYARQEDMINLLSSGDIGLMHIRNKWLAHRIGFSNRFVEYIMAEIPIISTPQEFSELINYQFNCCKFYSEDNFEEFELVLGELASNLQFYTENSRKAKYSLDWETEVIKLIDFYKKLNA
jgi:glycosyltransferase involved in cell wall biosynthesis